MNTPLHATSWITWIIEPHDPLIVRDGRPFGRIPGAQAISLPFPFPSTTTGGFRTHVWQQRGEQSDPQTIAAIKRVAVRGPLLVELPADHSSTIPRWMVPAPSDALFFEAEQLEQQTPEAQAWRKRLVPLQLPDGAQTDLTCTYPTLKHLVGLPRPDPRKPHKTPPRFWYWESFEEWLTRPAAEDEDLCTLAHIGHGGAQQESRTHVSIDPHKQSSRDEHLFQTRGLEFTHNRNRLALAIAVADETEPQDGGLSPLGGERRVVMWRKSTTPLPPLPTAILEAIQDSRACRIILLTPAHFEQGWKPAWLMEPREGVQPVLQAVAIQRPQVVSGWELAANHDNDNQNNSKKKAGGRPKPTRRLAPAGSVFFLKLEGEREPNAIEQWLRATWMHCISDDEQSRLDGFGLAVAGAWDRSFTMTR